MRILLAALAATSLTAGLGLAAARAADAPEGYYEERETYVAPRIERRVEHRVYVEEPSWRRVEIEEPVIEERVVVRRRVVEEVPPRWRRVRLHDERRWDRGYRGRYVEDGFGW